MEDRDAFDVTLKWRQSEVAKRMDIKRRTDKAELCLIVRGDEDVPAKRGGGGENLVLAHCTVGVAFFSCQNGFFLD
jgi:hypothetical protein